MWPEQLDNGKCKFFERYKDPYTGRSRRVSVTMDRHTRQTEKQAQRILQKKIDAILGQTDHHDMTYSDLLEEYLAQWLPTVKESTKRNTLRFDRYIADYINPDTLLSKIDKRLVRQMISKAQDDHNYPTLNRIRKRLHAVLNYAVAMEYLPTNPSNNVLVPKPAVVETSERVDFLPMDDIKALLVQMEGQGETAIIPLVKMMSLTGMRYGELAAVTVDKVDFHAKTILIKDTYDFNTNTVTTTKTKESTRTISVSDNILALVKEACQGKRKKDFIFSGRTGRPMSNSVFNKKLKKYMPEKELHTHVFRHSHISYLAEKGVPLKAIMDRVGHTDPKTTLRIYTHTTQRMQDTINQHVQNISF